MDQTELQAGDRVAFSFWGGLRAGTIEAIGRTGSTVFVRDDNNRLRWLNISSVRPLSALANGGAA